MKPFRLGVIGHGHIAQKFADCIHALPNSKIHAIASRSAGNLYQLVNNLKTISRKLNAA